MSDIDPVKLEEAIQQYEQYTGDVIRIVVDAARAHLATLPRFKEVEVWRVEWAHPGNKSWKPYVAHYLTEWEATAKADSCCNHPENHACVRVTGPHKQRVPA